MVRSVSQPTDLRRRAAAPEPGRGQSEFSLRSAVLAYSLLAWLVGWVSLGSTGIVSMEGMLVDGAQDMAASGELLVPRVYDEVYTYKPALSYWLAMLGLGPSGRGTPFSIRLPFVLTGFLMGLGVLLLIAQLVGTRIAWVAAAATLTSGLFLQKLKIAEYDVPLAAGVGIAIAAASWNLVRERERFSVWLLGYLGLTVGFLAKGVPALMLFSPGLLLATVAIGRVRRLFGWRHGLGFVVFVALVGSYLFFAVESDGTRVFDQPVFEARARGLEWTWGHLGQTLLKPLDVFVIFLPWSWALPFCFMGRRSRTRAPEEQRLLQCATAFVLCGLLAFMVTPTHEQRYYLPLAVPIGILAALGVRADAALGATAMQLRRRGAYLLAAVSSAAAVTLGLASESAKTGHGNRVALVALGLVLVAVLLTIVRRQPREHVALALFVAAMSVWAGETFALRTRRAAKRNLEPVAEALAPHIPTGEQLWVVGPASTAGKNSSLYYYLNRPVRTFALEGSLPPPNSMLVLTADNLEALHGRSDFRSTSITRCEHAFNTFLLERMD